MAAEWAGLEGNIDEGAWLVRGRGLWKRASKGRGLRRGRVLEKGAVPGTGGA